MADCASSWAGRTRCKRSRRACGERPIRGVREMVGKAKQRDTEELLSGVCTLGLSGWLAGATGCRSPVVAAGELDQEDHVPIGDACRLGCAGCGISGGRARCCRCCRGRACFRNISVGPPLPRAGRAHVSCDGYVVTNTQSCEPTGSVSHHCLRVVGV